MKNETLPETTKTALLRALGMLLQQVGMYGIQHNVSTLALREAFEQFESALAVYGAIELTKTEKAFLVNGEPIVSKDAIVHHVAQRIENNNLGGLVFNPGMDKDEFTTFATLISASPASLAPLGGMKQAIESAGLRTIATSDTAYQQVSDDIPPEANTPPQESEPGTATGVLDLSSALDDAEPEQKFQTSAPRDEHEARMEDLREKRRENVEKMAAMLRATATLVENEGMLPGDLGQQQILASIERILKMVETSSSETRTQIAKLAGQVDADRQTIASIESAARRRGIGFNLTRKELLDHYSEINQEMVQPITVSSGALDLLLSGKGGELSTSQKELIKLASESMQRVNQLVAFTNRISGLPESYTPNEKLIRDSYS